VQIGIAAIGLLQSQDDTLHSHKLRGFDVPVRGAGGGPARRARPGPPSLRRGLPTVTRNLREQAA
jgi:hypothetical protein